MGYKDMEGQMDFLGLISEYTDAQGATVRVREPAARRARPVLPVEPEQLSLDFEPDVSSSDISAVDAKPIDDSCSLKITELGKKEPGLPKRESETEVSTELTEKTPANEAASENEKQTKTTSLTEQVAIPTDAIKTESTIFTAISETKDSEQTPVIKESVEQIKEPVEQIKEPKKKSVRKTSNESVKAPVNEPINEITGESEEKSAKVPITEQKKEPEKTSTKLSITVQKQEQEKTITKATDDSRKVISSGSETGPIDKKEKLFKQCNRCWCFDCKHNSKNEAVPREMCGTRMACPACDGCIAEDCATICEIGNAKEGCMTRAIEEGIVVQEEFVY